ncbi:MAG: O-antigen ligase family protein, partial [Pseudonocardiaceae bacterium]
MTTLITAGHGELQAGVRSLSERRLWRVRLAWVLLLLNVLTFYGGAAMIVPLPSVVGQLITQGALLVALLVALSVNRPVRVRPTLFLLLLGLLPVQAMLISARSEFLLGAMFRSSRLALFVVVLWLLSPWWDRRDMLLVKTHLAALWVVLGTVLLGLALSPGLAMTDGRLAGVIWPIPWTQVGHYAAMVVGLSVVLWLTGLLRRSLALVAIVVGVGMLLLSHTRTALIALVAGVLLAGLSLFLARARVRRAFGVGIAVITVGAVTVSSAVVTWLARGQDAAQVGQLTGRTKVWDAVLAAPRTPFEMMFGTGLSDKSFNGLPIDSNWLATYNDLGLFGATVDGLLLLFVLVAAAFRPPGARRAIAVFIAVYCLVASFTETSL